MSVVCSSCAAAVRPSLESRRATGSAGRTECDRRARGEQAAGGRGACTRACTLGADAAQAQAHGFLVQNLSPGGTARRSARRCTLAEWRQSRARRPGQRLFPGGKNAPPLGDLRRHERRQPGSAGMACVAYAPDRRPARQGAAAAPKFQKPADAQPDRHAGGFRPAGALGAASCGRRRAATISHGCPTERAAARRCPADRRSP